MNLTGPALNLRPRYNVAPRFTTLANTAEGRERELSPSQRDFLDDFAAKLAEGAMEGNDEA